MAYAPQYENDYDIGVAVIDTYTHYILEFMEGINKTSQTTMEDLVRYTLVSAQQSFPSDQVYTVQHV